jgi:hypothetical protein
MTISNIIYKSTLKHTMNHNKIKIRKRIGVHPASSVLVLFLSEMERIIFLKMVWVNMRQALLKNKGKMIITPPSLH